MSVRPEFWLFLSMLAAASLVCRFGGFWLMRFVTITPRLETALKAMPLAVMTGIVTPALLRGSWPEWAGVATAAAVMRISGSDLAGALAGVAVVALGRSGHLVG
ncbi:MAG: AzlD family protein [Beijerinckiaceae bacterium]